jgi:hypothetical protein
MIGRATVSLVLRETLERRAERVELSGNVKPLPTAVLFS